MSDMHPEDFLANYDYFPIYGNCVYADIDAMALNDSSYLSDRCTNLTYKYDIVPAIVCATCFLLGLLHVFLGYRLFKYIMFMTGFVIGTSICFTVLNQYSRWDAIVDIGIALVMGIMCGLVTLFLKLLGIFLAGFQFGALIGLVILIIVEQFFHPPSEFGPLSGMGILGICFGCAFMAYKKIMLIFGTSFTGAAVSMVCVDYYVEKFMMAKYVLDRITAVISQPVCWFSWIVLGCWMPLFIAGVIIQRFVTAKNYNHQKANPKDDEKNQKVNLEKIRARERSERRHSHFRHLYKLRRSNGDVISKDFINDVNDQLSPAMRNFTNIQGLTENDSTNTTLTQINTASQEQPNYSHVVQIENNPQTSLDDQTVI